MQQLRHIVVGTDFSEGSEHALNAAMMMGSLTAARVTLVHVCTNDVSADCAKKLDDAVAARSTSGLTVTGVLRSGKAWEKLANVAAEVGASVIVVGRTGADGSSALGQVATRLVQSASRPVLVIPADPVAGLRR